jgi:glycosyltransferase involved in cell wall biosynthesis
MRIAEVAPLFFPVPPVRYGAVGRLIAYLTDELVAMGHEVTLFASGDSRTRARLIAPCAKATGFGADPGWSHVIQQGMVARHAREFDVIHVHEVGASLHHFPMLRLLDAPSVVTFHRTVPVTRDNTPFFEEFADIPLVSLSAAHRLPAPWLNWQATIYHGLPLNLYRPAIATSASSYLACIGRIARHKGLDEAIRIAGLAGRRLLIAGAPVTADDRSYLAELRAMASGDAVAGEVEFVGELDDAGKQTFLSGAAALLVPLVMEEPGPLTVIESLACATPVIGYRRSFLPEVIDAGVTGFIVDDVAGAVRAVAGLESVRREACRAAFEARFTIGRRAREYVDVFTRVRDARESLIPPAESARDRDARPSALADTAPRSP